MDSKASTKVLTPSAAQEIRRLYAAVDGRGRRKHTIWELADMFGVGETTAYRAIRRIGPYANLPDMKSEEEIQEESAASVRRLEELLKGPATEAPRQSAIDAFMNRSSPPASPLDGGEGAVAEPETVARMEQDIAVRDPNKLLQELKDEG